MTYGHRCALACCMLYSNMSHRDLIISLQYSYPVSRPSKERSGRVQAADLLATDGATIKVSCTYGTQVMLAASSPVGMTGPVDPAIASNNCLPGSSRASSSGVSLASGTGLASFTFWLGPVNSAPALSLIG